jgi:hypothetical protein
VTDERVVRVLRLCSGQGGSRRDSAGEGLVQCVHQVGGEVVGDSGNSRDDRGRAAVQQGGGEAEVFVAAARVGLSDLAGRVESTRFGCGLVCVWSLG